MIEALAKFVGERISKDYDERTGASLSTTRDLPTSGPSNIDKVSSEFVAY